MKKIYIFLFLVLPFICNADPKGDEIARKNDNLTSAKDTYSIAKMILIDKNNNKKVRRLEMYTKETKEGTDSFVRFLEPADVKGTTFLTNAHKEGDDEQRLYLPALGKVRRISSSSKDGKFMGSDLFYYDMEDRDLEESVYTYIRDEQYDGMDCHVVEMKPLNKDAPYSKTIGWFNKADNFLYKIECYDKRGKLLKIIIIKDVKNIKGVLTASNTIVDNVQDNHKTILMMEKMDINTGISSNIFTVQNLMK